MIHPKVEELCREIVADRLARVVTGPLADCILATQSHVRGRLSDMAWMLDGAGAAAIFYGHSEDGARLYALSQRATNLATSRCTEDTDAA